MAENRTEINTLGEFGLIKKIKSMFGGQPANASTQLGIGDDAAVVAPEGPSCLVSTDMLVEGIHFDLTYMPIKHLGYKAVTANLSDIAAMNGIPKQITVSVALSNRFSLEAMEAFYAGVKAACTAYKVDLVGGDTCASGAGLVVSVTALGEPANGRIARRDGANAGDIVCVTGDLGGAYVGLQVLEREKQVFLANPDMQPKLDGMDYIVQRQLKPEARVDIVHELASQGVAPTAMIDVSDGLASELLHLAEASGCTMRVYEDKLPIDKLTYDTAVGFNLDPITCVLNGGEDYELLFTIGQDDFEQLKNHPDIHFIGYVMPAGEPSHLITKNKNTVPLKAQGWNHFKDQ